MAITHILVQTQGTGAVAPLPPSVLVYIQSNSTDGDTTIVDRSSYNNPIVTSTGSVYHTTSDAKFGTSSLLFSNNDTLKIDAFPVNIGTGEFTIAFWYKPLTLGNDFFVSFLNRILAWQYDSTLLYNYFNGSGTFFNTYGALTVGNWHHLAFQRAGGGFTFYIDGNSNGASATSTDDLSTLNQPFYIGTDQGETTLGLDGYMDDFIFTNTALFSGTAFTPPTEPMYSLL